MAENRNNADDFSGPMLIIIAIVACIVLFYFFALPALKFYFTHSQGTFEFVIKHPGLFLLTDNQLAMFESYLRDMRGRQITKYSEQLAAAHWDMLTLWGLIVRTPVCLLFLYFGFRNFRKPESLKHMGEIPYKTLARLNSKKYPYTIPALNADPSQLSEYHYHGWEAPRTPIEFAVTEGLISHRGEHITITFDKFGPTDVTDRKTTADHKGIIPDYRECKLDIEKTDRLLCKQLGPRFHPRLKNPLDFSGIDPLLGLMATLFAGMACDGKTRNEAYLILDAVNRTFTDSWATGKKRKLILKNKLPANEPLSERFCWEVPKKRLKKLVDAIAKDRVYPEITRKIRSHAYVYTLLCSLLDASRGGARSKGKVPSDHFIFLRPYNKVVYAALNALGGQRPHQEAAAVWTHYESEKDANVALMEPSVQGATDALHKTLFDQQWVFDEQLNFEREREESLLMEDLARSREAYAAEAKKSSSSVLSLDAKGKKQ